MSKMEPATIFVQLFNYHPNSTAISFFDNDDHPHRQTQTLRLQVDGGQCLEIVATEEMWSAIAAKLNPN